MARTEQEFLDTFESGTVALDTGAINMPVDKFSKRFGITEQEETLSRVLPEEYKLSDVKQAHSDLEARKILGPAVIIP